MLTREQVINKIQQMPNTFSIDDLLEKILLLEKIETGMEQLKTKKIVSDNQLEKKRGKWLID